MDLTFTPEIERAALTARAFVDERPPHPVGPGPLAGLAGLVRESPLAHFVVFRELGRLPASWGEIFPAAGLEFHDLPGAGVSAEGARLTGLVYGDPRRGPEGAALGIDARPSVTHGDTWNLHGVALAPGYLAPVDSLLIAANVPGEVPDVGLFALAKLAERSVAPRHGLLRMELRGTSVRVLARGDQARDFLRGLRRRERLSQIALAVGAAGRAHDESLNAAREATRAKDPLALGQGVQFHVADSAIDLQVAETLALHCATLAEARTLPDATLASTRFMVLDAFARIAQRAAHVATLFAATPPAWSEVFLDLAHRLRLEGGAVELDRRDAARGLLQSA